MLDMTTTPIRITGVDFVYVPVSDFDRAKRFYGEVLGLPQSKQYGKMPGGEFETGTLTLQILQADAFGQQFNRNPNPIALGQNSTLTWLVTGVADTITIDQSIRAVNASDHRDVNPTRARVVVRGPSSTESEPVHRGAGRVPTSAGRSPWCSGGGRNALRKR